MIPPEKLAAVDLKKLVIERIRLGPDFEMQSLSGRMYARDDIINEIEKETEFGLVVLEAEIIRVKNLAGELTKGRDVKEGIIKFKENTKQTVLPPGSIQ